MRTADVTLRQVQPADLPALARIYDHYVAHSTCTFATEPTDATYWNTWIEEHVGPHPAVVAFPVGSTGVPPVGSMGVPGEEQVVAWGCLSSWNTRCAYRFSVEDTVYVEHTRHGQGIGRAVLGELIRLAGHLGHRSIIAQIAAGQPASEHLHHRFGFRRVGSLREVGFKFDRWIDVSLWQLMTERLSQNSCGTAVPAVETQARRLCHSIEIVSKRERDAARPTGGECGK